MDVLLTRTEQTQGFSQVLKSICMRLSEQLLLLEEREGKIDGVENFLPLNTCCWIFFPIESVQQSREEKKH